MSAVLSSLDAHMLHFFALTFIASLPLIACHPTLIVVSFDGFRNDYINETLTPHLYRLANDGVRGTMKSSFATKTYPNHQSIATGYYEETHGIVNNEMYDPLYKSTFNVDTSPDEWWNNNLSIPIWTANQMSGASRSSGAMMWPGSHVRYSGLPVKYLQEYDANLSWNRRLDIVIEWLTAPEQSANCVFIYFDEPDTTAHEYGPFSVQVLTQVKRADDAIGYFIEQLERHTLFNSSNLIILSDHGMAEIRKERVINLNTFVNDSWYDIYGASPVWSIEPKIGFEEVLYETLYNASKTMNFSVYKREEIPEEFHYRSHRRLLTYFLMADEGWDIYRNMAWTPKGIDVWGNHGYNNSLPSMQPLFIAHGPAFQRQYVKKTQFNNIDLYPLMCYVLQLFPLKQFPSNGSLSNVYDLLVPQLQIKDYDQTSKKLFDFFIFIFGGFGVLFFGSLCFICSASIGKSVRKTKPQDITWDSLSSGLDIDLRSNVNETKGLNSSVLSNSHFLDDDVIIRAKRLQKPEETILLLQDEDEEDLR